MNATKSAVAAVTYLTLMGCPKSEPPPETPESYNHDTYEAPKERVSVWRVDGHHFLGMVQDTNEDGRISHGDTFSLSSSHRYRFKPKPEDGEIMYMGGMRFPNGIANYIEEYWGNQWLTKGEYKTLQKKNFALIRMTLTGIITTNS